MNVKSSAAGLLKEYVQQNPSVRDCLQRGLINHSALARYVSKSKKCDQFEALVIASTRYGARLTKNPNLPEKRFRKLLKESRLIVQTRMLVASVTHQGDYERVGKLHSIVKKRKGHLTHIDGYEIQTIITGIEFESDVRATFRGSLQLLIPNVVQLLLLASEKAMFTSGFSAFVLNLIAQEGVNLLEELTSSGEHHLVIEERDLQKVLKALRIE